MMTNTLPTDLALGLLDKVFLKKPTISEIASDIGIKDSAIKRSRSKHPTGRGEQRQRAQSGNCCSAMREKAELKAGAFALPVPSKAVLIEAGIAEWEAEKAEAEPEVECMSNWSYDDYLDYCADEGLLVEEDEHDDELEEVYAAERDAGIKDVMAWDGVEFEHHSPFTKIRTWRTKKGTIAVSTSPYGVTYKNERPFSSVRLTERQFTADCGATVPAGYDPYEG